METAPQYQPRYVMLNHDNSQNLRAPPQRRNIPRYHSNDHHSAGKGCAKCFCCCICFLILLIILLGVLLFLTFTMLQPKMPKYGVDDFEVKAFNMSHDFSLYTEFVVTVKADNPNERIAFTYGEDSSVVVAYSDSTLCSGILPAFHQPFKNITMIQVVLKGKSEFGSGLQEALMDNRKTGRIPLLVMVKAPVSVMLQTIPIKEFNVYVNCSMVVDNLSPNKQARILSSAYSYSAGL